MAQPSLTGWGWEVLVNMYILSPNITDLAEFLVPVTEARALVEEGGIPVLVEIVEVGSQRQKEIAAAILLQLCEDSLVYRTMVAREGAIPPLIALSQSGTNRAKQKVSYYCHSFISFELLEFYYAPTKMIVNKGMVGETEYV